MSEAAFMPMIAEMAESYGHTMSKGAIMIYVKHLKGYTLEAVEAGIYAAIEKEDKFPSVHKLKKHLNHRKNFKIDEEAKRQARYVKGYFESGNEPPYHDPITCEVMETHLPFSDWKSRDAEDIAKFFMPMFVKAYKEIADDEAAFKDAQKKLGSKETARSIKSDDYLTETEKKNRDLVKELEAKTGESFYRYYLHPWAIFEGWYMRGKVIMFSDLEFVGKLLESDIFNQDYPRSVCFLQGKPKQEWPELKTEPAPKVISAQEASEILKPCLERLRASKGLKIYSNRRKGA